MPQNSNYSNTTPVADANNQLAKWKADAPSTDPTVIRNIAVEIPQMTPSGTGHQAGLVPDPGASAGAAKFLREDASWQTPAGAVVMGPSGPSHASGLTPDTPSSAGSVKFLREDASWAIPPGGAGSNVFGNGASIFTLNDVTGSRVVGTVYQNTTGKHILVLVGLNAGTGATNTVDVLSDAANPPTTKIWSMDQGSGALIPVMFLVKNNDHYEVTVSAGTANVPIAWYEYTMNTATVTDSGDLGPSGTAARALSTVYQNTSGSPKIVAVRITGMTASGRVNGISDSGAAPTATVFAADAQTSIITAFFLVPNGDYYKVTAASGAIGTWHEYTLAGVTCVKSADLSAKATANASSKRQFSGMPDELQAGANNQTPLQVYINTTGKDIWVAAPNTVTGNGTSRFFIDTEPAIPPQVGISQFTNNTGGSGRAKMLQGLVQPGQSYCAGADSSQTCTTIAWFEYQLS